MQLDMFVCQWDFTIHCLNPHLHVTLEQVSEQFFSVAGEKVYSLWRGERADDATNCYVVVLTFDDDLRDPDLVPGSLDKPAYEVVLYCSVHWVTSRIVEGTCNQYGRVLHIYLIQVDL